MAANAFTDRPAPAEQLSIDGPASVSSAGGPRRHHLVAVSDPTMDRDTVSVTVPAGRSGVRGRRSHGSPGSPAVPGSTSPPATPTGGASWPDCADGARAAARHRSRRARARARARDAFPGVGVCRPRGTGVRGRWVVGGGPSARVRAGDGAQGVQVQDRVGRAFQHAEVGRVRAGTSAGSRCVRWRAASRSTARASAGGRRARRRRSPARRPGGTEPFQVEGQQSAPSRAGPPRPARSRWCTTRRTPSCRA